MDFLDPKKRKAHSIKLLVGYLLVAMALTFASVILLYQSYGYDYDPKTGQIVQNGLVFVSAHPQGANVYINGTAKGRTDQRLDIKAGEYTLELREDGYRNWSRKFTLEGGSIERFIYPHLFPTDLQTSDVLVYESTPPMITESLDRKWVLIQQPGSLLSFDLVDVTATPARTTTISIPASLVTTAGANHTLEAIEWADDNKRVVLKHTHDGGTEFIVVDVESPASSLNISRSLNVPFTSLTLRDKKYDLYYLYNETDKTLLVASLKEGAKLYQSDVLAYRSHGENEVVFITTAGAPSGKALIKIREGENSYTIRQLTAGSKYVVDLARFEGSWYVAAGVAEENKVYLFKNPVATLKAKNERTALPIAVLRTPGAPEFISFSTNARFIASQSGNNFAVYDAETDRQFRYDAAAGLIAGQKATWMDGHRLTAVTASQSVVFDYDGTNKQTLNAAISGSVPLFDRDYEAMFTLSPSSKGDKRPALVRTELRVTD